MQINYDLLYRKGEIAGWYLRNSQWQFYKQLHEIKRPVAKCHRRFGKGTTVFTYVFEQMHKKKIIVRYGAETQRQAYGIYNYLCDQIHFRAHQLKPKWDNRTACFVTSNGSQLHIFGVKDGGEIDKARGSSSDIIIADEFGFWKHRPEYVIKDVLAPQLFEKNGQLIIISTPPPDMTHKFVDYCLEAEASSRLFNWTIKDSLGLGEISQAEYDRIVEDCGGEDSEVFRREWMCELVASSERLVIPEAQDEELYLGQSERPNHFDAYVCMDLGLVDHTFVCFAYVDFKQARLVVEEELMVNYTNTENLVHTCKVKEDAVYSNQIYKRLGDCEMQQLFDMTTSYGYTVTPISKRKSQSGRGFKESVLNGLRIGIKQGKVLIDPIACPNLAKQLKYGIWNDKRTDFERTDTMGHLDGIMSLAYLYDNIDWHHNPYPHSLEAFTSSNAYAPQESLDMTQLNSKNGLAKILGR